MEEVLEAVKGLASWDAWARLIAASRASPLARSQSLASFNFDEVVVMDGFLEVRHRLRRTHLWDSTATMPSSPRRPSCDQRAVTAPPALPSLSAPET